MTRRLMALMALCCAFAMAENRVYELRTYTCFEGKLEALEKMFRPFYRVDDARGRETGGVGLGLAITERTVRLHGGTVKAWNRPEGGLTVEIRLPCAPVPEAEAAPALASAGTHQNT